MNISKQNINLSLVAILPLNYSVAVVFYYDQPKYSLFISKYVPILFQWKP